MTTPWFPDDYDFVQRNSVQHDDKEDTNETSDER